MHVMLVDAVCRPCMADCYWCCRRQTNAVCRSEGCECNASFNELATLVHRTRRQTTQCLQAGSQQ